MNDERAEARREEVCALSVATRNKGIIICKRRAVTAGGSWSRGPTVEVLTGYSSNSRGIDKN